MAWKRISGGNYIKFEAGKQIEATYLGCEIRDNPFAEGKITDYKLLTTEGEKTLSSTAGTLDKQLKPLEINTKVMIEMVAKNGKKFYVVYLEENK